MSRAGGRAAVLLGAAFAIVAVITLRGGVPLPENVDGAVVTAQRARVESVTAAEVLILGDSSALTGVDVRALARALGRTSAESFALIGFVGPAGYGAVLDRLGARGVRPDVLVALFHREALVLDEDVFRNAPYERAVLGVTARSPRAFARDAKTRLVSVVHAALDFPMPGAWGATYGSPRQLRRHITEHHGTMEDPTRLRGGRGGVYDYRLSSAVARRLPALAAAIENAHPRCVAIGLMPSPAGNATHDMEERRVVLERIASAMRIPGGGVLDLPPSLEDRLFATTSHLTPEGRRLFTQALTERLAARDACGGRS